MIDLVTVIHNRTNRGFAKTLERALEIYEPECRLVIWDNETENLGFAKACNKAVEQTTTEIIGFINPDVIVNDSFADEVLKQFQEPNVMITGETFREGKVDQSHNGLKNWVCGAALFTRRQWFIDAGMFDEQFIWSWEETDLCRRAETQGYEVRPIHLALEHDREHVNTESLQDKSYKDHWFHQGRRLYRAKWR